MLTDLDGTRYGAGHTLRGEPTGDETPRYVAYGPSPDDVTCPGCGAAHLSFFSCWRCAARARVAARFSALA